MPDYPFISVIILNYNGKGFLKDCVASVLKSDYPEFEVLLVDNASTDDSLGEVQAEFGSDARLRIIRNPENMLFAGGNNAGIKEAKGDYIVILNNDTEAQESWLKEIATVFGDAKIGAAQPKILIHNTNPVKIDYAGTDLDRYGYTKGRGEGELDRGQYDEIKEIFFAGGTAMVLKRSILDEVGLFDDEFGAHWEDVDLSWRIRLRGYSIFLIPKAVVYHRRSATMSKFAKKEDIAWCIRKNRMAGLIKNYNLINLIKNLPVLLLIYALLFLWELITGPSMRYAASSPMALFWNIRELPYILRERRKVQGIIRRVKDDVILNALRRKPVLLDRLMMTSA